MEYTGLVNDITDVSRQIFGDKLYLHGSIAMGCYNPKKSDIDLIFVIGEELTDEEKLEFMKIVVKLNERAPKKGLELSVVKREFCQTFIYPTPFELHFSPMHLDWFLRDPKGYVENMKEPMYIVLNLCRVFAAVQEGLVLSKEQGGEWGLLHIAHDYHELIKNALESYTSEKEMSVDLRNL